MSHDFTVIALAGLALGVRHILGYMSRKNAGQHDPIEAWEGEGGAVPVAANRTAAQVAPFEAAQTS